MAMMHRSRWPLALAASCVLALTQARVLRGRGRADFVFDSVFGGEQWDLERDEAFRHAQSHWKPSPGLPGRFREMFSNQFNRTALENASSNSRVRLSGGDTELEGFMGTRAAGATMDNVESYLPADKEPRKETKLILWTPIVTFLWDVQRAHIDTWMQQPGVCHPRHYARADCHVFPIWVFGNVPTERRANISNITGDLILPIFGEKIREPHDESQRYPQEHNVMNMNLKTPFAIKYIQKNMPWATHVSRLDADAFPYISYILSDLNRLPQRGLVYGPMNRIEDMKPKKVALGSRPCEARMLIGYLSMVSRDLLDCWVDQEENHKDKLRNPRSGRWEYPLEDEIFSEILFGAQRDGLCPRLLCAQVMEPTGTILNNGLVAHHVMGAHRAEHPV